MTLYEALYEVYRWVQNTIFCRSIQPKWIQELPPGKWQIRPGLYLYIDRDDPIEKANTSLIESELEKTVNKHSSDTKETSK